jgi:hypothetical protein
MKNKNKLISLLIALALALTLLSSCAKSLNQMSAAELLNLGEKYLLEMDYEQAIVYFDRLIEVEPRNPRGYTGLAEAYIALGEQDKAIEALRRGLELLPGDQTIQAMLDELTPVAESALAPLAIKLIGLYETSGYEAVLNEMRAAEFAGEVTAAMTESNNEPIIHKEENDIGCGFYSVDGDIFVYIGGYDELIRSGNGIWLNTDSADKGYYMFTGIWTEDMPNGEGKSISAMDESTIEKEPGYTYPYETRTAGVFNNGIVEGTINEQWDMDDGHTHNWNLTAISGRYQRIDEEHGVLGNCSECNAYMMDGGVIAGVKGFID